MYEMMKREKCMPDETVYNQLLLGCIKYEDYKRAWGTFEHMRYEIAQIGVKTMTIMINLCTIEDKVEKALGLVDEMILNKQPITDVTFNSLINACAHRKGYFDEAFSLLAKMEMAGFKPDYYTYNTLLYACAKNKNLEMARLIFNKITESKDKDMMRLDASSFTNLFYVYSSHLRATNTLTRKQAIERMVEKGESIRVVSPQDLAELNAKPQTKPSSILGMFEQLSREHDDETIQHPLVNDTGSNPGKKALDLVKRTEPTQLIRAEVSPPSFNQIVPVDHSSVLEEAKQIYSFYLSIANTLPSSVDYKINSRELVSQSNTKKATRRVLNAYLSILVNCGDFDNAWNFYCLEYDRLGCKRDGFTLEIALNLANATRDVNMAWIVWSQFREWRLLVEKAIQPQKDLDAFVKLKSFESIDSELDSKFTAIGRILNKQSKAAQTNTVDIKKWFALPSANSKISYSVRESIRSSLGCNKTQEYQVYRQMILLLARNDHLRTSLRLLYDLKHNIIDHSFASFNINDFKTIYVRAAQLGDLRAKSKFLKLCKPDQRESLIAENKKYLNFKWGTKNKGFYIGPKNAEDMISQYEEDIEGEAASTQ
ncbi:Pentatricopeptide repeat-containing protein [Zancudomyces culisetae]|uniref:Pentatricopeptide repeat-containing protein n=1 Tax=Zancudomyces culisetae TaxID=1213189 RepID=A0A1R1PM14_ZANCU|nr:Pentatricopeptide repeat-containing protein [Zancudomyces culisetae]|eukprot:OMH81996.1 Pentatricopeptide repeat-containing protein [Zancudomyces culisetae]